MFRKPCAAGFPRLATAPRLPLPAELRPGFT
jgi:hypothetical protein